MWGEEGRNYSGHRGSSNTGSHTTTFNERKFKENFEEPKRRRNHRGNRTMLDGPHSPEFSIIRAFIPKESSGKKPGINA